MDKIKVLYIDDEGINLLAFKASFRRIFEVFTAKSADEGIDVLKSHPIEVVLSDQRMPGKTGVDFFEEIKDLYPTPIRILITAFSDIESIIDAVNKGNIYRYVTKPWSNFELQLTIENSHKLYKLKEENNNLILKYEKIFSVSTDPIILLDEQCIIMDYNPATLSLLDNENLKSSSFKLFFTTEDEIQTMIDLLKEKSQIQNYECQIITSTGEKKACLISGNLLTNNYGEFINYQLILII